jgi:uncharacterized protein YcfL
MKKIVIAFIALFATVACSKKNEDYQKAAANP